MGQLRQTLHEVNGLTAERRKQLMDERQQAGEYLGPSGSPFAFTNAQGHEIAAYLWPVARPKGVIILVHGQGSYLVYEYGRSAGVGRPKLYDGSWIHSMNDAGYSVAGIDNQGAGRSGGLFGYIDSFSHLVDDIIHLCKILQASGAPDGFGASLPLFGVGVSMGGGIVLQAAMRKKALFQGLVLLAPMLSLERAKRAPGNRILLWVLAMLADSSARGVAPCVQFVVLPISKALSAVVPTWPLIKTARNPKFPELAQDWDLDPAVYHYPVRIRVGTQLLAACDWLAPRMEDVETPLLVFHSEHDPLTDPDGSKALVSRARSTDKTLRVVNEFWHRLTQESGNEVLLAEALEWMDLRAGEAAGTTTCCIRAGHVVS
ncbi:hypothetical protein MNEG_1342 [Monoraphidium neglectum]|uniref:Serine aminopeptidase S33 domain-containing protein n=1 Tax=Monoraphidium neglectum TaxID=145388 RepID=A0A0D2K8V8_9CHLO|nr:hypothetical protein MNEG_1342 [Monoraphidium neglectum]KIZ06608.1 hypothetical protein MNEG_1342 [Monoraphidium neglectum]|eukprot:XP_013905627.1 hypothetical protein MNEG_1342 [Monoraphidium neglectum]